MKSTPFFDIHTQLNAKMSSFGGYQMPIQYNGVKQEHLAVREKLGIFDVSHMGEFRVEGPMAFHLLQYVCSNDLSKLSPGKAQYNYLPNDQGGVVDDLIEISQSFNVNAQVVGHVEASPIKELIIQTPNGSFEYH